MIFDEWYDGTVRQILIEEFTILIERTSHLNNQNIIDAFDNIKQSTIKELVKTTTYYRLFVDDIRLNYLPEELYDYIFIIHNDSLAEYGKITNIQEDILIWFKEHNIHYKSVYFEAMEGWCSHSFAFNNRTDAMKFKLTWG